MSPAGRRIWRGIIASKPVDWFDADQLESLLGHCENRARFNELSLRLAQEDVGSKAFRELAVNLKMIGTTVASSARQLRLTVQNTADRRQAKLAEKGSAMSGDVLVGGLAIRRRAA